MDSGEHIAVRPVEAHVGTHTGRTLTFQLLLLFRRQ